MLDVVDTAFHFERELIVCSFLQRFFNGKGSSLQLIYSAHNAFLLCGIHSHHHGGRIQSVKCCLYILILDHH